MPVSAEGQPRPDAATSRLRIAAAGDVHCGAATDPGALAAAFAAAAEKVDVILLAGDLTTHGEPEQAAILAGACAGLEVPVLTVLGNHDWHANRRDEVVAALTEGGIDVVDPGHRILQVDGAEVGIVGAKGFVGGFPGSHMPDFGEPSLRRVYAEGVAEVDGLTEGLRAVAHCPFRIVLLHYAPTTETLEGERRDIWAFLGTDRLAPPIVEHAPDLVLHGHAHAGTFQGQVAGVPVYNVSVPVLGEDFWVFSLTGAERMPSPIH
jgi:Icc-related predicted phosphoesterase